MHPHRSSALDGAAATLTVARTRGVAVPLSWSWSHHPQGRAWAAASARGDTFDRKGTAQSIHERELQPPTLSPEVSDAAASAAHAPYSRLCAAEAAEA